MSSLRSLTVLLLGALAANATAQVSQSWEFEFDVDGVLPDAHPDVNLFNNTGQPVDQLFTVSGDLLLQTTFAHAGNASFNAGAIAVPPTGATLDPAEELVLEAELAVSSINGSAGVYFQCFDGRARYQVSFIPGGVRVATHSGNVDVAVDLSQMHVYRLESPADSSLLRLFIDGTLAVTAFALPDTTNNGFGFGDGHSPGGNGADAQWEAMRIFQGAGLLTGVGDPYCGGNTCPCGNDDDDSGCANSSGVGALLHSTGSASVGADDLVLRADFLPPNQFGLIFMGGAATSAPFGDGVRCVAPGAATLCRFPVQNAGPEGRLTLGPGVVGLTQSMSPACQIQVGDTWYFQGWYRDPNGPCGSTFNVSTALAITFEN